MDQPKFKREDVSVDDLLSAEANEIRIWRPDGSLEVKSTEPCNHFRRPFDDFPGAS